jgi:hypothetical protein
VSGKLLPVVTDHLGEDKAMGNRDVRSREKKKPKKKEVKVTYQPARPVTVYKPTPAAPPTKPAEPTKP